MTTHSQGEMKVQIPASARKVHSKPRSLTLNWRASTLSRVQAMPNPDLCSWFLKRILNRSPRRKFRRLENRGLLFGKSLKTEAEGSWPRSAATDRTRAPGAPPSSVRLLEPRRWDLWSPACTPTITRGNRSQCLKIRNVGTCVNSKS